MSNVSKAQIAALNGKRHPGISAWDWQSIEMAVDASPDDADGALVMATWVLQLMTEQKVRRGWTFKMPDGARNLISNVASALDLDAASRVVFIKEASDKIRAVMTQEKA
jgi:hypothetical protein